MLAVSGFGRKLIGCNHSHSRYINIPGLDFMTPIASNFISNQLPKTLENISYLPQKVSLWRRNFKHESMRLLTRNTNNKLFVIADQLKQFQDLYKLGEETWSDTKDIAVVVCLGKKKKGKSFNASMISLVLSDEPCHFGIGSKDIHFTVGLEISPILPLRKPPRQVQKLCILDFEGHESDDTSDDKMTLNIMKTIINELNPVILLCCLNQINNEDIKFCREFAECGEKAAKPPLIVALPPGTVTEPEKGDNYAKIKHFYPNCVFCELPWLIEKSNKKVRTTMQQLPFGNPTRYMSKSEIAHYRNLAKMVLDYATDCSDRRSSSQQIVEAIDKIKNMVENGADRKV